LNAAGIFTVALSGENVAMMLSSLLAEEPGELPWEKIFFFFGDPGSDALNETSKWATENWVEKFKSYRITLTYPVLNNAVLLIVLVAGSDKAPIVGKVLEK
jgi:6-phosphogluconolactonase/glucosamine-6-phosphate isomerase/deaminase